MDLHLEDSTKLAINFSHKNAVIRQTNSSILFCFSLSQTDNNDTHIHT